MPILLKLLNIFLTFYLEGLTTFSCDVGCKMASCDVILSTADLQQKRRDDMSSTLLANLLTFIHADNTVRKISEQMSPSTSSQIQDTIIWWIQEQEKQLTCGGVWQLPLTVTVLDLQSKDATLDSLRIVSGRKLAVRHFLVKFGSNAEVHGPVI